jgi:hypothetical protein
MKTVQVRNMKSKLTVLLIGIFSFACQKTGVMADDHGHHGTSSVHIFLTDDPSLVFDHVFLDISQVEIKVEDDTEATHESEHQGEADDSDSRGEISGGWITVPIHPGVYDILQFRNGLDTLFATTTFDASKNLKKVRITLGINNSVMFNGNSFPLTLHGNDYFIVVKLDESSVAINSGGLTNFWVDIDAGRSIRQHGSSFELKPSVKVFSKEKSGGIEGRVLPGNASAIVMAINGTDTATAKPEAEGEFKFMGLKPGTYTLVYHATANNYLDATVNNVVLSGTEDVHVPDVTLHQ